MEDGTSKVSGHPPTHMKCVAYARYIFMDLNVEYPFFFFLLVKYWYHRVTSNKPKTRRRMMMMCMTVCPSGRIDSRMIDTASLGTVYICADIQKGEEKNCIRIMPW